MEWHQAHVLSYDYQFCHNMRAVIIDDEKKGREGLKNLLEEFCPEVIVEATASTVDNGIEIIRKHNPDLVFLDIEMQTATGFDLLDRFGNITFEVIFATAYDQYAIKAFKFNALDYLLKPIDIQELKLAVKKVKERLGVKKAAKDDLSANAKQTENVRLVLSTSEGVFFVENSSILRCDADGAYTHFHLKDGRKIMISKNIKEYEHLLGESHFCRVHNSHIINLKEVDRYIKADGIAIMKDGKEIPVSVTKRDEFLLKMINF